MKKITLAIFIFFGVTYNVFGQNLNVFDVKYLINVQEEIVGNDKANPYIHVYTNKDYALIKSELILGNYDYLVNKKNVDSLNTLINHEDKNFLEVSNNYGILDFYDIDLSSTKTKTIQGYPCRLATVKYTEEEDLGLDIWYCPEIPYFDLTNFAFLKKIPGIALEMSTENFTIEAFEVNKTTLPQSTFEIPEDYTEMEVDAAVEVAYNDIGEDRFYYEDETGAYFGLKDADGNLLTQPIYFSMSPFNGAVSIVTNDEGKYGAIDIDGKEIMPLQYDYLLYDGISNQYQFSVNGKFGLIEDGKILIPAEYDLVNFMKNDLAIFTKNLKDGLINRENKVLIPAKYNNILDNSADVFVVQDSDALMSLYSIPSGKKLASKYDSISLGTDDDPILVSKEGKYGYINKQGKVIIPVKYVYATIFTEGYAVVAYDDNLEDVHYINSAGKKIDPTEFEY